MRETTADAEALRSFLSSAEPTLGVELLRLVAQLEMQGVASRRIAGNGADRLARFDVLSRAHRSTCQVTVDRDVSAVANEDITESAHGENGRHVPFIHRTRLGRRRTREVDALVVEGNAAQARHIVRTEVTGHGVSSVDRYGKSALVS